MIYFYNAYLLNMDANTEPPALPMPIVPGVTVPYLASKETIERCTKRRQTLLKSAPYLINKSVLAQYVQNMDPKYQQLVQCFADTTVWDVKSRLLAQSSAKEMFLEIAHERKIIPRKYVAWNDFIAKFGNPGKQLLTVAGSYVAHTIFQYNRYEVANVTFVPHGFKIVNGVINHPSLFPIIQVQGIPNCMMHLVLKSEAPNYKNANTQISLNERFKLMGIYSHIQLELIKMAKEITRQVIIDSGYFNNKQA